jgi:alkyl hydroperoxide reductase subunit F
MYELIIIGAGPAGITASVYAGRKKMNFLVVTRDIGGQALWSAEVENYTGYQFISGPDLVAKFEEHLRKYNITVKEDEPVIELKKEGAAFLVKTAKSEYLTRTVVIASGKRSRQLNIPGEKEYRGKGLSYCVTCDGPLFSGKEVAVIGGGNSALDACLQLERIAAKVYLINMTQVLSGDAVMLEKVQASPKITIINNTLVTAVVGDKMVSGLAVTRANNKAEFIPLEGVFVEIGLIPNSDFAGIVAQNEMAEIIVDCRSQTNVPGIFAAGDVTSVPEKQIIVACGEGAKATLAAFRYLAKQRL